MSGTLRRSAFFISNNSFPFAHNNLPEYNWPQGLQKHQKPTFKKILQVYLPTFIHTSCKLLILLIYLQRHPRCRTYKRTVLNVLSSTPLNLANWKTEKIGDRLFILRLCHNYAFSIKHNWHIAWVNCSLFSVEGNARA